MCVNIKGMEHSENKVNMQSELIENEIRPGVLQSSFQQTCALQHQKAQSVGYSLCGILAGRCLLDPKREHSKSKLVYKICNHFIFGMLYLDQFAVIR